MQCYNQRMIENLKARQQQEKNRLPKIQRGEAKTRMAMFKKSLRINSTGSSSEDRERIKQVAWIRPPLPERDATCEPSTVVSVNFFCPSSSFLSRRTSGRRPRGCISSTNTRTR